MKKLLLMLFILFSMNITNLNAFEESSLVNPLVLLAETVSAENPTIKKRTYDDIEEIEVTNKKKTAKELKQAAANGDLEAIKSLEATREKYNATARLKYHKRKQAAADGNPEAIKLIEKKRERDNAFYFLKYHRMKQAAEQGCENATEWIEKKCKRDNTQRFLTYHAMKQAAEQGFEDATEWIEKRRVNARSRYHAMKQAAANGDPDAIE